MNQRVSSLKKQQKRNVLIRWFLLLFFLVFITFISVLHQYPSMLGRTLSIDSFCPMGGLEGLFAWIFQGQILQRLALSSFLLFFAVIIIAIVYRRSFCGQICPLGTLQEIFGSFGRKMLKKRPTIPQKTDKWLRYIKYIVLVSFLVGTWATGVLIIRAFDPWVAYAHLLSEDLFIEFSVGFVVLLVSLFGSVWIDRLFCKYFCPFGAFLSFLSPLGIFGIKRNVETCIKCKKCDVACPMNIKVSESVFVSNKECIMCNDCVNACPIENTLEVSTKSGKSTSTPIKVTILSASILLLVAIVFSFSGQFKWFFPDTTTPYHEQSIKSDPEDIRGFMTLQEISTVYGVPLDVLIERFASSPDDANKAIKELPEVDGEHTTDVVREFVRDYRKDN